MLLNVAFPDEFNNMNWRRLKMFTKKLKTLFSNLFLDEFNEHHLEFRFDELSRQILLKILLKFTHWKM